MNRIKRAMLRAEKPSTTEHAVAQIVSTFLPVLVITLISPPAGLIAIVAIGTFRGVTGG